MYASRFRLTDLPFRPLPDTRFVVETPQRRAALDALHAAFARGDAFMLVTGAFGTGKTLVAEQFAEALPATQVTTARMLAGGRGGERLMQGIATAFGIPPEDGVTPVAALLEAIEDHAQDGRAMLLVLDEAQALDADALRRLRGLSSLGGGARPVFRTMLVGEHAPLGLDPATPAAHLVPFSAAETRAYVVQRLRRAAGQACRRSTTACWTRSTRRVAACRGRSTGSRTACCSTPSTTAR